LYENLTEELIQLATARLGRDILLSQVHRARHVICFVVRESHRGTHTTSDKLHLHAQHGDRWVWTDLIPKNKKNCSLPHC